jgi:peptidoglycan-associated lipoprotein
MKFQRVLLALSAAGLVAAYGCGGQQPTGPAARIVAPTIGKGAAVMKEQLAVVPKANLDATILPAARPPLAATPDLSSAVYTVNAATLSVMAKNGVPGDAINGLRKLDGKSYDNTADFVSAVSHAIGQGPARTSLPAILRGALVVTLAEGLAEPKGQLTLDEAAVQSRVAKPSPPPPPPPRSEPQPAQAPHEITYRSVYFGTGASVITPEFAATLKENADRLIQSKANVTIEGHCDERGSSEYNLALGKRRAEVVRKALVNDGVPEAQLEAISYGKAQPVDSGHDEAAWAKNRRVVLTNR